jgi:excisionase family DNA binding protein
MKPEHMSVVEMCRTLGISLDNAYRLIYSGKIEAKKVDGKWQVSRSSVMERLRRRKHA